MNTKTYNCAACGKSFEKSISVTTKDGVYQGCPHCRCWDFAKKKKAKITKQELKQYALLLREIKSMQEKLLHLKKEGEKYRDIYELCENNKLRALALTMKIESFIFNIDDSLIRQIMDARYIHALSWTAVAAKLGGYYSPDYVRIIHDRYLKSIE